MDDAKKHSILIVDDDTSNILNLTHILSPDYTIYVVKNGTKAVKAAEKYIPDVILLDIVMPDMDGYDVISALKKIEKLKNIPVIFITGLSDAEDEEKGLALGAADYLVKPFSEALVRLRVQNQIKLIEHFRIKLEEAEIINKAKTAFLANMSHEIRTPMNAICGITEFLMQDSSIPEEAMEGISRIHNSSYLLLGIINDILDLSKIEAGKLDIMPAKYYVASLVNDSIQLNIMRLGEKPIDFEVKIDENVPAKLIGDELRIKQMLNNLLSNAFKYTESGKVTLLAAFEHSEGAGTLVVQVRDTGCGMTKEQVRELFDEYSRFNVETGRKIEGTGLGMAITRHLLDLMGGSVSVESEPGKGSQFTVRLPQGVVDDEVLGREVSENLRQFRTMNSASKRKRHDFTHENMPYGSVLIVDDVETNLYVAEGLMKPYGLKIDTVMSGTKTIDIIGSGKVYDIIFMDHMMPVMDGIETVKHLRGLGYDSPIVAMTANAILGQSEMFLQNGFDDFISKPVDIRRLNAVLNRLIRDKQPPEVLEAARSQINSSEPTQAKPKVEASFIRDAKKTIAVLEELQENFGFGTDEGMHMFTVHVHGIKSGLSIIGEQALSEAAKKLEAAGREKNLDMIAAHTPEFLSRLRALTEDIEKKRGATGEDDEGEDAAELLKNLSDIREKCADYNRKGALDILESLRQVSCSSRTREVFNRLTELLLNSEYDKAKAAAGEYMVVLETEGDTVTVASLMASREIEGLDMLSGLDRYHGDGDTYLKILRSYAASARTVLDVVEGAGEENLKHYEITVHGIKGASYDVFATAIGDGAKALEMAAKAGDLEYISKHNGAFLKTVQKLISDVDEMLMAINAEGRKPKKDCPDEAILEDLAAACELYDMDGADTAMAEIEKYQYISDEGLASWLRENVDLVNFEQIVKRIRG